MNASPTTKAQDYRTRISRPLFAPRRACILVPSGKLDRMDRPGFERELHERLTGFALPLGCMVVQFDGDAPAPGRSASSESKLARRADRLAHALSFAAAECNGPVSVFATSLGALATLKVLAKPGEVRIDRVVLASCVVEDMSVVMLPISDITMLYGSRDYIAYVAGTQDAPASVVAPEEYSLESSQKLVVRRESRTAVHVLCGRGHYLELPGAQSPDHELVALLSQLLFE